MLLSQMFRTRPKAQPSEFKPSCDDCQKYRDMIKQAHDNGNVLFLDALRADFEKHCNKEHSHARIES